MRHGIWVAGFAALTTAFMGCSSARVVSVSPQGGCVAIVDNSDTWPSYNRTRAIDLMSKQCPKGYTILKEEEVVVGQTTTNSSQRDTTSVPIAKGLAVDVQQTARRSTEVRDRTEYRIWYQKN